MNGMIWLKYEIENMRKRLRDFCSHMGSKAACAAYRLKRGVPFMKKLLALVLALALCLTLVAGAASAEATGKVYYLNFKPEADEAWQALAKTYTEQTGVPVTVVTAASGTYENTLRSELEKADAPTLFQVNGPVGLKTWRDYCLDLRDTALYRNLKSDDFALIEDGQVLGVAYVIETYGLIYNRTILDKYMAMDGAVIQSADQINNFETLKAVAEDIQARREELGVLGAFTSAGMDASSDWRFKTHLANLPVYYEYKADGITSTEAIKGTYLDNYRAIWDLYINNATCDPSELTMKTATDAVNEFVGGQAVFYQNGTWAYGDVSSLGDENLDMLPIYIGVDGEESQGICVGTENFFAINSQAPAEKQKLAADFIYWLYSSDTGKDFVTNKLGFIAPFDTFAEDERPTDPLAREVSAWMSKEGVSSVPWSAFLVFPSQTFKDDFGAALLQYAQGTKTWDDVKTLVVDEWKAESNL